MTRLDDVGQADGWRCWLCDEPVDPDMSVNDDRGPSIDSMTSKSKAKGKGPDSLFVSDPASIVTSAERLARKRGSEAMGRCPTEADAVAAAEWLVDRLSRLAPGLHVESRIQEGGGQYVVVLTS